MARKTNYAFDRNNRAKAKAAKREAKRQAKLTAKAEKLDGRPDEPMTEDASPQGEGSVDNRAEDTAPPESS